MVPLAPTTGVASCSGRKWWNGLFSLFGPGSPVELSDGSIEVRPSHLNLSDSSYFACLSRFMLHYARSWSRCAFLRCQSVWEGKDPRPI